MQTSFVKILGVTIILKLCKTNSKLSRTRQQPGWQLVRRRRRQDTPEGRQAAEEPTMGEVSGGSVTEWIGGG